MRTYSELTPDQKTAAFNYHLNSLMDIETVTDLKAEAKRLAPEALADAQTALYGDDPATGILPVTFSPIPPATPGSVIQ